MYESTDHAHDVAMVARIGEVVWLPRTTRIVNIM